MAMQMLQNAVDFMLHGLENYGLPSIYSVQLCGFRPYGCNLLRFEDGKQKCLSSYYKLLLRRAMLFFDYNKSCRINRRAFFVTMTDYTDENFNSIMLFVTRN